MSCIQFPSRCDGPLIVPLPIAQLSRVSSPISATAHRRSTRFVYTQPEPLVNEFLLTLCVISPAPLSFSLLQF